MDLNDNWKFADDWKPLFAPESISFSSFLLYKDPWYNPHLEPNEVALQLPSVLGFLEHSQKAKLYGAS